MAERVSHPIYQRSNERTAVKHDGSKYLKKLSTMAKDTTIILTVLGFIIGRVSILDMLFPFGMAYLVSTALLTETKNSTIIGTSIIAGLLTRINDYQTIHSIMSIMLMYLIIKILKLSDKTSTLKAAIMAFGVNFIVSLFSNVLMNGTLILYDTLMGLFNSTIVMALVYIYNYSLPLIIQVKNRKVLSNEEIICISILCSIVISGLSDIYIYGISLKVILSVMAIAVAAYGQGAGVGSAIGTTVGLITCISSNQVPMIIGTYGFCGMLAGIFRDMGKTGAILGFIIADIVILFYMGAEGTIIGLKELAIGLVLFTMLPSSFIGRLLPLVDRAAREDIEQRSYVEKMKDLLRVKIAHVIDVFSELSRALEDNESDDKLRQSSEVNTMINSIIDKTCSDCEARSICWQRDFYRTYQNMFEMLDVVQTDGSVGMDTIPQDLKSKCLKANQIIKTTNYIYDIYKMNYKWRQKAKEGKRVVSQQLEGIAGILGRLSEEVRQEVDFKGDIEEELAVALDREGVQFNDIVVIRDDTGKYQVNMYRRACLGRRECIKDIGPVVSRVLKRKMKRDKASCMIKEGTNLCYFRLVEAVKYQISTGIAREVKDKGGLSGDNYSFIELDDGKYMMAISDGMGTGPAAAMESNSAITLLEKYLEAGFDKATALKAINSVMALRSPEDNFTTVDLAITDLYTGDVEIIKVGAASTFIKRTNGSIEIINSTSLPIGILNNIDIESKKVRLHHGDMIIMVTDGVEEAGNNDGGFWLARALEEIDSRNPQQVAEDLLAKARERTGNTITDDMTVLVSKVWEVV